MRCICVRPIILIFLFVCFALPLHAAVFSPHTRTLGNGLQVVVVVNNRAPIVSHMLWVKVGSADEDEGHSGLAHYLEHLMFKGTAKVPNGEYSRRIARMGGNDNAFTSADYTTYFATIAPQHLGMVMEMEADRLMGLQLTEDVAKPELAVVLDERRQRVDSDPFGIFSQEVQAALYPVHPYGRPVIGWQEEIARMDAALATAFYKKWYSPSNAVVVVSGDVVPENVFALAEKTYGALPKTTVPERVRATDPPFTSNHTLKSESARVKDTTVVWTARVPSRFKDKELSYAFEVLGQVLSATDGALLSRRMIGAGKPATECDVSYEPDALDETAFSFTLLAAKNVRAEDVVAALEKNLKELSEKPLPQQEVDTAKAALTRAAILARDSVMGPAYAFGMALSTGQNVEDVEGWPERIKAVSPEKLQEALKLLLGARRVVGIMHPSKEGADQ